MSLVTLADARLVDPDIDQSRIDALESMVRAVSGNRFAVDYARYHGLEMASGGLLTILDDGPEIFQEDTLELSRARTLSGLYRVVSIDSDGVLTVTRSGGGQVRETGSYPRADVDLIEYPPDVSAGVLDLIAFGVKVRETGGVKSKSVGRVSETYGDPWVNTPAGSFPSSLLTFLAPYRQMRWDGMP